MCILFVGEKNSGKSRTIAQFIKQTGDAESIDAFDTMDLHPILNEYRYKEHTITEVDGDYDTARLRSLYIKNADFICLCIASLPSEAHNEIMEDIVCFGKASSTIALFTKEKMTLCQLPFITMSNAQAYQLLACRIDQLSHKEETDSLNSLKGLLDFTLVSSQYSYTESSSTDNATLSCRSSFSSSSSLQMHHYKHAPLHSSCATLLAYQDAATFTGDDNISQ